MSSAYTLNKADIVKWFSNLGLFLVPVVLIYFTAVIASVNNSGVSFSAFVPDQLTVGAMVLYILNAVVDILRKFQAGQ